MSAIARPPAQRTAQDDEPTPDPASAVAKAPHSPESTRRLAQEAFVAHFSNPSHQTGDIHNAWEKALVLYGNEDSDAWMLALENGTHPLCQVGMITRPG
ncbi:MAG: hypothetical protein IPK82_38075 [Polyangiaceae bacterium]|nr:hypothetical protein [Polyangiaceae bacterium]